MRETNSLIARVLALRSPCNLDSNIPSLDGTKQQQQGMIS